VCVCVRACACVYLYIHYSLVFCLAFRSSAPKGQTKPAYGFTSPACRGADANLFQGRVKPSRTTTAAAADAAEARRCQELSVCVSRRWAGDRQGAAGGLFVLRDAVTAMQGWSEEEEEEEDMAERSRVFWSRIISTFPRMIAGPGGCHRAFGIW